ncbi:hypothetical protein CJ255_07435 [Candidatus Viridilinea mediisalina]|uniref:Uncharacterized protein n=2 Tax=Candidatus Viridilinea mediisalina TaxID=2024553 RepID=A0A2A6RLE2_9CHLR|nr:hypothetical protein CJ255_07435 [Candidatus Viridilinea mediisalina]
MFTYTWSRLAVVGPLLLRQRYPNGQLSGEVTAQPRVTGREYFFPEAVTDHAGTTVVIWNGNARYRYAFARDGDITQWQGPGLVADVESFGRPSLAVGANNEIGVAFMSRGNIYMGLWNGIGFDIQTVSETNLFDADPSMTFMSDGSPVVAWRSSDGGVFYSVRQPNGAWPTSRLLNDTAEGRVGVSADAADNLGFSWVVDGRLYAAYISADGGVVGPIHLPSAPDPVFNGAIAMSLEDRSYMQVVVERFGGLGLRTDYFLLSAQGALAVTPTPTITPTPTPPPISAQPVIEGGAELVRATQSVSVTFTEVEGDPTHVRWNWGAEPTHENPWVAYQPTIAVTLPTNLQQCTPYTLYTQVREDETVEEEPKSASVAFDNAVDASIRIANPHHPTTNPVFTPLVSELLDLGTDHGAFGGDPSFIREAAFYLEIEGADDCSGLKEFRVGASADTLGRPFGIVDGFFANIVAIPGSPSDGPVNVTVQVTDQSGNVRTESARLTLDRVRPVLESGELAEIRLNEHANILSTLVFSNVTVTDTFPGGYWGVWLANSLNPISNPLIDQGLNWIPVEIGPAWRSDNSQPIVDNWSLAGGLRVSLPNLRRLEDPTFYVYARFLDGAGNPTDTFISQTVRVDGSLTFPQTYLPLVQR